MATPNHYSLQLPDRCLHLIDELWSCVENVYDPANPHAGPMTTTFLLAMAMPIVILPIERIQKQRQNEGYVNDRPIEPGVAEAVDAAFGGKFRESPFFIQGAWSYATWPPDTNIARDMPSRLLQELSSQAAYGRAESMNASQWSSVLRNALAHGGVAYLDAKGAATSGNQADMFCFVSGKKVDGTLLRLDCLRISEANFRNFLAQWVRWLRDSKVTSLMAA
jgi:hypothetical protein